MRRLLGLCSVILLSVALTACSAGVVVDEYPGAPTFFVSSRATDSVAEAAVSGTVEVRGGCFVLVDASAEGTWMLRLPHGARRSVEDPAVLLVDGIEVRAGDDMEASGGWGGEGSPAPEVCDIPDASGYADVDLLIGVSPGRSGFGSEPAAQ